MEELRNMTFIDLIRHRVIRIPKIQRDYAEGRKIEKVKMVRRTFLNALLQVVFSDDVRLQLDFIYGYDRDDAFEPLDGQQRLTTLFLLHWMFCPSSSSDLRRCVNRRIRSVFTYETRVSSEEFCNEIVLRDAASLYSEATQKGISISTLIQKKDWFKWGWRQDPSVQSILVVMDEVCTLIRENGYAFSTDRYPRLSAITFHLLNLPDFKLGDELYVKMNARGKQLSSFDILKATLEEEIEHQILFASHEDEKARLLSIEAAWRKLMDSDWIDYFWQKRIHNADGTVAVADVEQKFMRMLVRLVSLQFIDDSNDELRELAGSRDERSIESLIPHYIAQAWRARRANDAGFRFIDFQRIIDDMNALIAYTEQDQRKSWFDVGKFLEQECRWDVDASGSIIDLYLSDTFVHPVSVGFYGVLSFLRRKPLRSIISSTGEIDDTTLKDLCDWYRFLRNCSLRENTNDRFDNPQKVLAAFKLIDGWMNSYVSSEASTSILRFISNRSNEPGFERQRVIEEALKAKLRLENDSWTKILHNAEDNWYLRGQVLMLLQWSAVGDQYDTDIFQSYFQKLSKVLDLFCPMNAVDEENASRAHKLIKFYQAMLSLSDYRFGKHKTMGIESPADRDYSWKRYLRDKVNDTYAPALKAFIDVWKVQYSTIDDIGEFCQILIATNAPSITDWRRFLIECPKLLTIDSQEYTCWRVIGEHDGHDYLALRKTEHSRSKEILISYVYENIPGEKRICDSSQPQGDANSVEFRKDGKLYRVRVEKGGTYEVLVDGASQKGLHREDVLLRVGLTFADIGQQALKS